MMDNDPTGEDIERTLMDLGVNIKEEIADELLDAAAPLTSNAAEGVAEGGAETPGGADSLASPPARASWATTRCIWCTTLLVQADGTPKLLECLHSACQTCVHARLGPPANLLCTTCQLTSQPANLVDQRFVLEAQALEATGGATAQTCSSCEDPEPATSYCVDCADFICDNCVTAHQRLKITKDHTIKSKDEVGAELTAAAVSRAPEMFCLEHPAERLTLFCETCERLTCRDCQLAHHRDHRYQFSGEMAAAARSGVATLLQDVAYKRALLASAARVIRERQALIADKKRALVHDITQVVVRLTSAVNARGKQLVLRLGEVCDAKQRVLAEKREALRRLAAVTEHCAAVAGAALEAGSDTALLHSKRALTAQLQRVKARRADIPNPDVPVRIALALDNLPDMLHVLAHMGGIVVDGKPDTPAPPAAPAAPAAPAPTQQGPYHPPPQQLQQHLQHQMANNAMHQNNSVAALQQVAMQQSFVQQASCRGGLRARHQSPLRQPHVTSSTHPQHDPGLRALLRPPAPRPQLYHAYHQLIGAYAASANAAYGAGPSTSRREQRPPPMYTAPPTSAPNTPPAAATPPSLAKWHVPQHYANAAGQLDMGMSSGGTDYKITLARPPSAPRPPTAAHTPQAVTSTNPKTPSPSLNGAATSLDRVCADSVQDLMATIAKLDSNGVQVLPEHSPRVHSSTDDKSGSVPSAALPQANSVVASGDPNEDWCAVCMDGGELMCCDKCPKVFHQYCHIPTIDKLPEETETWQCLLCVNFADLPPDSAPPVAGGPTQRQLKIMERITLELYCQYETGLHFREPVPVQNTEYHSVITRPMCLDLVRARLQPSPRRYPSIEHYLMDVRTIFSNAYIFNAVDSQVYKDAKRLEEFFDAQLLKWLPEYVQHRATPDSLPPPHKRPRLVTE